MQPMPIYLPFETESDVRAVAVFVAQLVREGVTFEASRQGADLVVKLTGGF